MKIEKNLSTCKPSEFLRQTVKIRKLVADWLDASKLLDLAKNMPKFEPINPEIPEAEKLEIKKTRMQIITKHIQDRIWDIFDSICDKNADKTLALLALVNFVDPANVDDYEVGDYLQSLGELIADERVMSFFISLVRLGQVNI